MRNLKLFLSKYANTQFLLHMSQNLNKEDQNFVIFFLKFELKLKNIEKNSQSEIYLIYLN